MTTTTTDQPTPTTPPAPPTIADELRAFARELQEVEAQLSPGPWTIENDGVGHGLAIRHQGGELGNDVCVLWRGNTRHRIDGDGILRMRNAMRAVARLLLSCADMADTCAMLARLRDGLPVNAPMMPPLHVVAEARAAFAPCDEEESGDE